MSNFWYLPISYAIYLLAFYGYNGINIIKDKPLSDSFVPLKFWFFILLLIIAYASEFGFMIIAEFIKENKY